MKKVKFFLVILVLFIGLPHVVKAESQEEKTAKINIVNQYIADALSDQEWQTTLDRNIYRVRIDVANLNEKIDGNLTMEEALKSIATKLFNGSEYNSQMAVIACLDSSSCGWYSYSANIAFTLYKDDTKAYLYAPAMEQRTFEIFKNAKKIMYSISSNIDGIGGDVPKEGEFSGSPLFDNSNLPSYEGSRANPYIINENKSLTVPSEEDSYWDTASDSCIYFRFDFESPTTYARYFITPAEIVNFKIYDATFLQNLRGDGIEEGLFQVSNQLLYAFCDEYGTTVNFKFKDTEKLNVYFDDGSGGDVNLIDPDNPIDPNDNKPFDPNGLCGDDGENCNIDLNHVCNAPTVARTLKFIGILLFILKILVPAIIIVMGFVNLFKIITSSKPEEAPKYAKNIVLRVVIGVIIFLAPTIINFVFDTVNTILNGEDKRSSFENCVNCILDTENCKIYD